MKTSPYCHTIKISRESRHVVEESHLFSTVEEELVGVNAVGDGAPNQWDPMKNKRRFPWILKQKLSKDVDDDCERK